METYISIITLNVNRLNTPNKRHSLDEQIQKQDTYICYLQDPLQTQGHIQGESDGTDTLHANGNQKKDGVAVLISDKIDFKMMSVKRDKEGH